MHSKSYLRYTIFMAFLSISVHGFHVDTSDTPSTSEPITSIAVPKNASEFLSKSSVELIKQIMVVQVQLSVQMKEMEKQYIELGLKKEAEQQKDEIKKLQELLKQMEQSINKTAAELRNKEEKVELRETQVQKKEQSVDQAENEIKIKAKSIKEEEQLVKQREQNINATQIEIANREKYLETVEVEIKRKEAAIEWKKVEIAEQVKLVELREEIVNETKLLMEVKKDMLKQGEETLKKKETEISAEKERIKKREEDLDKREKDLEMQKVDANKQSEVIKQLAETHNKTDSQLKLRETEVKRKEDLINKKETEVKNIEEKLKQIEKSACTVSWVPASDGSVPANALVGGQDKTETLYVGRTNHNGSLIPGKIHPSHDGILFADYGHEYGSRKYEVATFDEKNICRVFWVKASDGSVPTNAIVGGYDSHGENLYIGRAIHEGYLTPGKVQPSRHCLLISYHHLEYCYNEYEVAVIEL